MVSLGSRKALCINDDVLKGSGSDGRQGAAGGDGGVPAALVNERCLDLQQRRTVRGGWDGRCSGMGAGRELGGAGRGWIMLMYQAWGAGSGLVTLHGLASRWCTPTASR